MADRRVFFATNRRWNDADAGFGVLPEEPASRVWLGTVDVGVSADPLVEGRVSPPRRTGNDDLAPGGACSGVLSAWLLEAASTGAVPLLSVHGFNYTFAEACARAGNLCDWLEAAGGIRLVPLAFTWPSNGDGSLAAYPKDQQQCAASDVALARLVHAIAEATAAALRPGRKPAWLAHSMGARATRCAMQVLNRGPAAIPQRLFGQALIMAGDDDTTVLDTGTGPLLPLLELADWTTIGVYAKDPPLTHISAARNGRRRLGAHGPDRLPQPADRCYVVDYGRAVDHRFDIPGGTTWNDVGHQYYRADARVRRDMVAALGGAAPEAVPGRRWARPDPTTGGSERAGRLYVLEDKTTSVANAPQLPNSAA
ncbi:MAG: alpha/beta hydrolase [Acetobacteraceae bacterium]|nr:alpha/beta hydrolase [Acetobacteraceae bacterium]